MDRTAARPYITNAIRIEDHGFGTPCWISTKNPHKHTGYTLTYFRGKRWLTHRLAYTAFVGEIPVGLQIDHLCRVRSCCNPDHLEPVTGRVNTLRGVSLSAQYAVATHCVHGHEFTPENTKIKKHGRARACRECDRQQKRESRARSRAS
jgi:hypothetical protein